MIMTSNNHITLYKAIILVIIYLTLYIAFLWLTSYTTGGWYLLISYTYFCPASLFSSGKYHLFILCIYESISVFVLFVFNSTYVWNSSFSDLILFHLAKYPLRLPMISQMARFFFFMVSSIPLCECVHAISSLFICLLMDI